VQTRGGCGRLNLGGKRLKEIRWIAIRLLDFWCAHAQIVLVMANGNLEGSDWTAG